MTPKQKRIHDRIYFSAPRIYLFISSKFEYDGFIHVIIRSINDSKLFDEYVFIIREIDYLIGILKNFTSKYIFNLICIDTFEYIEKLIICKCIENHIPFETHNNSDIVLKLSEIFIMILKKELKHLEYHEENRLKFEFIIDCYRKRKQIVNTKR